MTADRTTKCSTTNAAPVRGRSRPAGGAVVVVSLSLLTVLAACTAPASAPHGGPARSSATLRDGTVHAASSGDRNPYFSAPFVVERNGYTFGQDPTWTPDGRVLSSESDGSGVKQIYVSDLNGTGISCLTCGQPGPNTFPQERPQGDWILFCSWRGQTTTFGAPCLGGVGADLYVMRPDGSHVTRLTAPGMTFEAEGVVSDNYHPAWSPDGTHLVWTHLDFVGKEKGGTQWTNLVADFSDAPDGTPRLGNVTVVSPGGNNAYETQVWAPDGSGFLYTSFTSHGDKSVGWLNTELHFLRLFGNGASPAHPQDTQLTDNHPGWDEQAVFTPDMNDVIFMSSRSSPTWYQTVVTAAQQTGYAPPLENDVTGAMFVLTVLDPQFHTDLFELDLSTHAVRQLTNRKSVVPEFYFDPSGTRILWSEGAGDKRTNIGRFDTSAPVARVRAAPLQPGDWNGARQSTDKEPPPSINSATSSTDPAFDVRHLPPSILESVTLLESQLTTLAHRLQGLPGGATCCRQ